WFSIWIDYNKDGDFTDSGELILQFKQTTTGYTAHSFTVPAAAVSGLTRMRISMKHGSYSTSCENFQNGEVEDYTINIVPQKLEAPTIENKVRVTVLPDPATELITVDFKGFTGKVFLKIYNTSGQLMWNEAYIEERNVQLEVVNFPKGVYLLELNDEAGTVQALKWIKQ
ncbi:MAG TPA: GEVED domain-containing protein, partial [Chitinophagales bacterium]|nr:GEVED domain-containing protein [Chitinophagales bacterium]